MKNPVCRFGIAVAPHGAIIISKPGSTQRNLIRFGARGTNHISIVGIPRGKLFAILPLYKCGALVAQKHVHGSGVSPVAVNAGGMVAWISEGMCLTVQIDAAIEFQERLNRRTVRADDETQIGAGRNARNEVSVFEVRGVGVGDPIGVEARISVGAVLSHIGHPSGFAPVLSGWRAGAARFMVGRLGAAPRKRKVPTGWRDHLDFAVAISAVVVFHGIVE